MKEAAVEVLIDQQAESSSNVMGVSTRKLSTPTSSEPTLVVKIQDGENNLASIQLNGNSSTANNATATETSKRGRGRPKKIPNVDTPTPSPSTTGPSFRGRGKGRGRGGTAQVTSKEEAKKRGRGRPPKSKETDPSKENNANPGELEKATSHSLALPDVDDEFLHESKEEDQFVKEFDDSLSLGNQSLELVSDNLLEDTEMATPNSITTEVKKPRTIRVVGECASSESSTTPSATPSPCGSRTNSPRGMKRGRGRGRGGGLNGLNKHLLKNGVTNRRKSLESLDDNAMAKKFQQQIKNENSGNLSDLEGNPRMSPKVMMNDIVESLNNLESTKLEIKNRLSSFKHITTSHYMCAKKVIKAAEVYLECECTMSIEDHKAKIKGCQDGCLNRDLKMECGKDCPLGKLCGNKRFQNVENAPTEVFKTTNKGVGLRATQEIPGGTFIREYVGEVLDPTQFEKKSKKYSKQNVEHFYFMSLDNSQYIDATSQGNISRFINHSCNPNAETQKWTVNGLLRIGFFTKRRITKGEEITFDYKYERYGKVAQKCYCGSGNCRGLLGGEADEADEEEEEEEEELDSETSSSSEEEPFEEQPQPEQPLLKPEQQKQQQEVIDDDSIEKDADFKITDEENRPSIKSSSQHHTPVLQQTLRGPLKKITAANIINNKLLPSNKKPRRKRRSPRKIKNFEAEDYDEEFEKIRNTGIRTKYHTRDLIRRMIQTTDLNHKVILADLLRSADPPCRRLFIDYRGLFILGNWIADLTEQTKGEMDLIMAVEEALAVLTIPDKQVLVESKLWDTVNKWSHEITPSIDNSTSSVNTDNDNVQIKDDINQVEKIVQPNKSAIADALTKQVEVQENNEHPEDIKNEVEAIEKKGVKAETDDNKNNHDQNQNLRSLIQAKANRILESWSLLQDTKFKIPKTYRAAQRAQHELEMEDHRPSPPTSEASFDNQKIEAIYNSQHSKPWSYYEQDFTVSGRPHSPPNQMKPPRKRPRPSRFDDETGELNNPRIDRNALRHLYRKKAQQEDIEKETRENILIYHRHKCKYLCLDPAVTPLFRRCPEYYYNPDTRQWYPLPELEDPILEPERHFPMFHQHGGIGYPRMANMPVEAFRGLHEVEELPHPSRLYPPGIVQLSTFFGCPMSLDPSIPEKIAKQKSEQELLPITYIDPDTGMEFPIPELSPEEFESLDAKRRQMRPKTPPKRAPSLEDSMEVTMDTTSSASMDFESFLLNGDDKAVEEDITRLLDITDIPLSLPDQIVKLPTLANAGSGKVTMSSAASEVRIRLKPDWKIATDPEGRIYYYNSKTRETSWDPPIRDDNDNEVTGNDGKIQEVETASTASEDPDGDVDLEEDNSPDSDDEEDNDSDNEEENGTLEGKSMSEILPTSADIVSDLSEHEKLLLLRNNRKKSKEERQHERRQKREQNREKREYEKKRRRERHGKHRRDGLVQEHFIPRRTEKEKADLMTFEEMRVRLANRDAIREKQEQEERAEEEREFEEAARQRREYREAERQAAQQSKGVKQQQPQRQQQEQVPQQIVAAPADTSSEAAKKYKERFRKETSEVVVRTLDPYHKVEATTGRIKNKEDFKYLAKKLTNYIVEKELSHCPKLKDLKCNEAKKKKIESYVRKHMSKFGEEGYKRED